MEFKDGESKVLRSLIHEKFPFQLRVELDILSKDRSINNREKQQELFLLLRKYEIDGMVKLGSGTNRYAFKLDGYVVKFATDHDGKIDNFKEFKMAKRLIPAVTKIYEVSTNGTILIAEYIQPFESFYQMCKYKDEIRKILSDLSDVYLIGDVGISEKNYSNWGIRMSDDKPACLDFAYVYEVSTKLFLCTYCNTDSMLRPDEDFNILRCSRPGCGKKYEFSDIRVRLGNEIHNQEIGDLAQEGYELSASNVLTKLNLQRSNYLTRFVNPKTKKKKKSKWKGEDDDE